MPKTCSSVNRSFKPRIFSLTLGKLTLKDFEKIGFFGPISSEKNPIFSKSFKNHRKHVFYGFHSPKTRFWWFKKFLEGLDPFFKWFYAKNHQKSCFLEKEHVVWLNFSKKSGSINIRKWCSFVALQLIIGCLGWKEDFWLQKNWSLTSPLWKITSWWWKTIFFGHFFQRIVTDTQRKSCSS